MKILAMILLLEVAASHGRSAQTEDRNPSLHHSYSFQSNAPTDAQVGHYLGRSVQTEDRNPSQLSSYYGSNVPTGIGHAIGRSAQTEERKS